MKIAPIINQLATYLPFHTDKFTDSISVISASQLGGVATIETSEPHNLAIGQVVLTTEIIPLVEISAVSLINEDQLLISTLSDNGLVDTFDFLTTKSIDFETPKLYMTGFANVVYNGSFPIISVSNRYRATCQLPSIPVSPPALGGKLLHYAANGYVGVKTVTAIITPTTFQFAIDAGQPPTTLNSGTLHLNARISGAIDVIRAEDSYTKQPSNDYWLFVTQNDSFASKNRNVLNDGLDNSTMGTEYRQRLVESINVFVFVPTSGQLSAREAVDSLEDIKVALFKTLLRFNAPIQYDAKSSFQLYFDSTNVVTYTTSYLVQQFIFQAEYDLTYFDGFDPNIYRPFRNIDGISIINSNQLGWGIDLDGDV